MTRIFLLSFFLPNLLMAQVLSAESIGFEDEKLNASDQRFLEYGDFGSRSIGNNLSTNNNTLREGEWTAGNLYMARGMTDKWSVGTSFFVLGSFQMLNLMTRYVYNLNSQESLGLDLAYFKTYERYFQMEAANAKVTYSNHLLPWYRCNSTLSYFYYWDERMPFSFRMDPANSDPFALNLTSLHEIRLHRHLFINYEVGVWGLNYHYTYFHTGAKVVVQMSNWLMGIGATTTFSPSFPAQKAKTFAGYDSRSSVHPEMELQFFF